MVCGVRSSNLLVAFLILLYLDCDSICKESCKQSFQSCSKPVGYLRARRRMAAALKRASGEYVVL